MQQIIYYCFLNRSGYAQAAQDYIYALKGLNQYEIKISLLHSQPDQLGVSPERYHELMGLMRVPQKENAIQLFHSIPGLQLRTQKLEKHIGFGVFETFDPPRDWIEILNQNKAVICPSHFNVQTFAHAGLKVPIHHVPHCYNPEHYNLDVKPLEKDERFTFMFIGTWRKRKGYIQLLEAWMREFSIKDPVRLLIKTDKYTIAKRTIEEMKVSLGFEKKEIAPIVLEGRVFNELDMPRFLKMGDCLVSPTLGEGFGIPGMLCMSLGIPIIITNFSGCQDYANENTAVLIEPTQHIIYNELDQLPQFRNHRWAHVTVDSVASSLRYVLNNPDAVKQKVQNALSHVEQNYSYPVVAKKLQSVIESV